MPDWIVTIIGALITGGITLLGVIISNNKTMAVQNEQIKQVESKQKKLEDKQEKIESEVHEINATVRSHGTAINSLTKKVDTMEQNMISFMK